MESNMIETDHNDTLLSLEGLKNAGQPSAADARSAMIVLNGTRWPDEPSTQRRVALLLSFFTGYTGETQ
jgi:hypothetical protein